VPAQAVDVATVRALVGANPHVLLVDVRTPAEFESTHIEGAINLPLGQVDRHLERISQDAGGQMVLICQSGSRAEQCREKLAGAGLRETAVMSGGMAAWAAAGAPVVEGPGRWALERQVRLVAGGIVLLSVIAGFWWPPAVWIAGFIGAGLTFAAITDTCAMGMALTRLPYNQPRNKVDIEASLHRISRDAG